MEQKTDNISDEQLVYMINDGNEEANNILYEKYNNLIYKELNKVKISSYALHIEWQDLVQEAMVGFANAISSFNQEFEAKFSTYATLCIRRRLFNFLKKHSSGNNFLSNNTVSIDLVNNDISVDISTDQEPLNKLIIDELLDEVFEKISKLTEEEQKILDYATNGIKPEIIARMTGKNVKSVYNILHRVRKKLKL